MFVKLGMQFALMSAFAEMLVDLPTCRAVLYTERFGMSRRNNGAKTK